MIPAKIYIYRTNYCPTLGLGDRHGEKEVFLEILFAHLPIIRSIEIHSTEGRDKSQDRDERLMEI